MDTLEVRRALAADLEAAGRIWQESAETLSQLDPRYRTAPDGLERWKSARLAGLANPDQCLFVALRRGEVMAYLCGTLKPNLPGLLPEQIGVIDELAVDSHGHGGGPGRLLLEAMIGWLRERGISRVEIRVPRQNAIAQAFWRAIGAREWYDLMWFKVRSNDSG